MNELANTPRTLPVTDRRKWFIVAVIISLLIHVVLFEIIQNQKISGKAFYDLVLGKPFKIQRVELEPPKPLPIARDVTKAPGTKNVAPETTISSPPPFPDMKREPLKVSPPAPAPGASKPAEKKVPIPGSELPAVPKESPRSAQPAEEVLAIQKEAMKEKIPAPSAPGSQLPPLPGTGDQASATPSGTAKTMPESLAGGTSEGGPAAPGTGKILAGPVPGEDSGTGPIPSGPLPEVLAAKKIPMRDNDHLLRDDIGGERPYQQLNQWMNIDLYVYQERKGERLDGYFMLRITAKENNILKVIPKDVDFIIDSSSSIGAGRLFEFKTGASRSLRDLNPRDRFNLLVFKKKTQPFAGAWVKPSSAALTDVANFLRDVDSEGRTDIFRALTPLTNLPREKDRMRMAILMSDGLATEGEKSTTRIINQFTAKNDRATSLFALSGGKNVNPFLLEFLAYQNQGLTLYVPQENQIAHEFHQFYLSVKDPLLMDLEFKFAGVAPEEVYPRNLPHIYQNTPLKIYGRYDPADEKLFSMQILGQSFGSTKELLAREAFDKAKKGTRQIAVDWGKQKIYYLIGQTLRHDSPELQTEIRRVAREYGIDLSFWE